MIDFKDSIKQLENLTIKPVGIQKLYITQTRGRILAEDIEACFNSPAFRTSSMDGYAIRADDQTKKSLKVLSDLPAGSQITQEIGEGEAIKCFTGSLVPNSADTVIPIENVHFSDGYIRINKAVPKGFSIREVGENFALGDRVLKVHTKLDYSEIGVMASLNVVKAFVYRQPDVAILATGSEILEVGQTQTLDAQIRSSNNYTLEALVRKYGGNPIQFGAISDDKEAIKEKFNEALASADIVVSTGGVSVGDYDFVKDIVQSELGFEVIFKGVKIKPGQHVMLAQRNNQFIVALPGFAFSSTVTALLYLVPLIARMQGLKEATRLFRARLREDFKKRSNKSEFTPCRVCLEAGEYVVDFEDKKVGTSAIMTNMLGDTALIVSAPSDGDKIAGEYVQIMML